MPEMTFNGFDEFAQSLENIGKLEQKHLTEIAKAGAQVLLATLKDDERFGKYATMKKTKRGNYSLYYEGETSRGIYRAFGAAKVYEEGRSGVTGKHPTTQKARPFFSNILNFSKDTAKKKMEEKCNEILSKLSGVNNND